MTPDTPTHDLLVVGGLTVDRFPDGSSRPGGSVVHIARAAATRDLRIAIVTAAGPEPAALAGVDELRRSAGFVEAGVIPATTAYRHQESTEGRRLWLDHAGAQVVFTADVAERIRSQAVLYAPVAEEVAVEALMVSDAAPTRGATLQGWLRTADPSGEVRPRPLSELAPALVEALSRLDLLVASREDLLADADDPRSQLGSMRLVFGPQPALIVTDGLEGLWLDVEQSDAAPEPQHLPVPWRVDEVSTVGAGDILAGFMLVPDADTAAGHLTRKAAAAMRVVAEVLEERRRGQ
jgi:sugar/nucleoside kinase (ribokinase family)